MGMEYVNIGTDTLVSEYANAIMDTDVRIKPCGGLWCTECKNPDSLPWLNYMLDTPRIFFRKAPQNNPFLQKGVLLTLKTGAKVFELKGEEGRELLSTKYKSSYEEMSKYYDGCYIDICNIFGRDGREREENFRLFSVSTLILFNLGAIDSYRKLSIDIDPFDYYDYDKDAFYRVTVGDEKHTIEPLSNEYLELLVNICIKYRNFILAEKSKYPHVSTNQIAYMLYKQLETEYKREIEEIAKKKDLDSKKLIYSLSSNAIRRVTI